MPRERHTEKVKSLIVVTQFHYPTGIRIREKHLLPKYVSLWVMKYEIAWHPHYTILMQNAQALIKILLLYRILILLTGKITPHPIVFASGLLQKLRMVRLCYFSNGRRAAKFHGSNVYPYNFDHLLDLFEIENDD